MNLRWQVSLFGLLLLAGSGLSCELTKMGAGKKQPPEEIVWDLSRSHRIQDVGWPAETSKNFHRDIYVRQGDILMTLKLPGGKVFKERIRAVYCYRREGENVSSITLQTHNKTVDEAYQDAKRLIAYWGLHEKDLDEWYRKRKMGVREISDTFDSIRNDIDPPLALEILHSFNDEKPWFISFDVSFRDSTEEEVRDRKRELQGGTSQDVER